MRIISLLCALFFVFTAAAEDKPGFTLHEWGTFTSVSGSDGVLLPGLEAEQELLPAFFHHHDGMPPATTGYSRPLENVTVKLDAPVICFYTKEAFQGHIQTQFHGGSINEWFPQRNGGENPPHYEAANGLFTGGDIDFARKYHGSIDWLFDVQPPSADDNRAVTKPGEPLSWSYVRRLDSALLRTPKGEAEKFLTFGGMGNFPMPLKFKLPDDSTVHLENNSQSAIPFLLILNHPQNDDKASFTLLDPVKPGEEKTVTLPEPSPSTNWLTGVRQALRGKLIEAGLFADEADAMLQSCQPGYFDRPGLRVFWIMPDKVAGAVLPMTVVPAASEQKRVLVCRTELLAPSFEKQLKKDFAKTDQNRWVGDRFYGAYAARVYYMKTNP